MSATILTKSVIGLRLTSSSRFVGRGLIDTMKAFNSTSTNLSNDSEKFVQIETIGDKGIIVLNRPKALNAISVDMVKQMDTQLRAWVSGGQVKMVVIKSASEKAFCSGGDIKSIIASGLEEGRSFFRHEYTLDNLVGSISIPYIALINGIVMGGGCGLSVHGNFRIATEKAIFAMPETAIGLFPDAGASHFLNRLPGSLGLYFGLTGHRLHGRDIFKAGIATHFIPSDKIQNIEQEIMRLEDPDLLKIDRILQKYQEQWEDDYRKEFSLKPHIGRINSIFGQANSVDDIMNGLKKDNSEWSQKHLELLNKMSPTSLKLTFEQLKRGKSLTLPQCLKMEFRMAWRVLEKSEFSEGVRAMLIDKDNKPKWNPSKLEDVSEAEIQAYFEPLPEGLDLQV